MTKIYICVVTVVGVGGHIEVPPVSAEAPGGGCCCVFIRQWVQRGCVTSRPDWGVLFTETLKVPVQLWLWCLQVIPTTSSMETLGRWKPMARARKMKGKEGASRERIMLSLVWLQKGSIAWEGDRNGQLRPQHSDFGLRFMVIGKPMRNYTD